MKMRHINFRFFSKKVIFAIAVIVLVSGFSAGIARAAITLLTVTSPNGTEQWRGTQTITWTSDGVPSDTVNIVYSNNNFSTQSLIASGVSNSGSYNWDTTSTVFPDPGSTYKIRFINDSNFVFDTSDADFMVDNEDPSTAESLSGGPDGANGWYVTVPTITLSCSDGSGSGCLNTYYDWDNSSPATTYSAPVSPAEGTHTLYYFSEDQAVDNVGDHNQEGVNSSIFKVDLTDPTVAVTSTTANGSYKEGSNINVTLSFSEPVTSTGAITVNLDSGGSCDISAFSEQTEVTCTYTVSGGENSLDLEETSFTLGGTVKDIAGRDLDTTPTGNISDASDIVIDTTAPANFTVGAVNTIGGTHVSGWWNASNTGASVNVPIDNDSSLVGGTVQLQAEADGAYENVGSGETIIGGILGSTHTMTLTAAELEGLTGFSDGDNIQFRAVITDLAGNSTTGTESSQSLDVDQTAPTVDAGTDKEVNALVSQDADASDITSGIDTILWTRENGSGTVTFSASDAIDTDLSADTDNTYTLRLTVTDAAGNSAYDEMTFVWDTTAPVLSEVTPIANPTNDTTPSYTFNADNVGHLSGHSGGAVTYGGSCTAGDLSTAVDGDNTTTYATLSDATYNDCTIAVTDAAGNTSSDLTLSSFEIDTVAATVLSITTEDTDPNGKVDQATITFDDEVDDSTFLAGDFTINGTVATSITTGTPDDNTFVLTFGTEIDGTDAKTLTYSGTATDLAGNTILGFSNLATDLAKPMLISARTVSTTSIEATFSEDLNGTTVNSGGGEFSVASGGYAISAASETSPGVVTLTVATMPTDATPSVTYTQVDSLQDLASAPNTAVTPVTVTAVDGVAPVLTSVHIESNNAKDTSLSKSGDVVTVSFTASESVSTPTVTIDGQTATLSGGPTAWTASYTMTGTDTEGSVPFTIDFSDIATPTPNDGVQVTAVTDASSMFYDRTAPTVDAGTDKEVNATVSQDATTSDPSPSSSIDTWTWSQESGPGTVTFSSSNTEDTDISADTDGTYTLRLTVEDNAGNSAYDEMTFVWDTTSPEPITSSPSDGATGIELSAGTATVAFDEPVVLLDSSRILLVKDSDGTSLKGAVSVNGSDSTKIDIDYSNLSYGTKYRINVKPGAVSDVATNVLLSNFISYFTAVIDTVPPVVNSSNASSITMTGATLNVTTDENATCAFSTTDSNYASMTAFDTTGGSTHAHTLSGLSPSTGYNYYVRCADTTAQTNTMTTSSTVSFTTLTPDTTGPVISNIQATSITETEATITWDTDENATSRVEYGPTSAYGSFSPIDSSADNTSHSVTLSSLSDGSDYHFRVISADASLNNSTSGDNIFTTVAAADTTPPGVPVFTTANVTIDADTYNIAGTVADDDGTRIVTVYNNSDVAGTVSVPAGNTAWTLLVTLNQDAANIFTAEATDEVGNTSNLSNPALSIIEATVEGDTEAPATPVISSSDGTVEDVSNYNLSGTAGADTPDDGPRTITIYRGSTVIGSLVLSTGATDWSFVAPLIKDSVNIFTAYSTDESGNWSGASNSVSITEVTSADTTPPVITLLGQNPLTLTVGDTFTDPGATASDDVDGDISGEIIIDNSSVNMSAAGTYTVTYNVEDSAGNSAEEETRTVIVNEAFDDTATLVVTGIDAVKTYATADDDYVDGWRWTYHVTVPTDETQFSMKFSDFVSGTNSIVAANNIRFYTAQASANADDSNAVTITGANAYSSAITLDSDLESGIAGRQIDVTVEMKVPVGSAGGSYSGSYGINSDTP